MRAVLLIVALAAAGCTSAGAQPEAQLTERQIGPIRLGMNEADIRALGFELTREDAEGEGGEFVRVTVDLGEGQRVVADLYDDRAVDLDTTSPAMRTERGAHVGMTLSELRQLYPAAELNIGRAEGRYFNLRLADGVFFMFDSSLLPASCFEYRGECPAPGDHRATSYSLRDYSQ